ncbi:MAG: dihydrolipoyl dehydrogenase [Vampirovibrionia bacterium]
MNYDLAILGAGPGGYVAAIRAAQLGLSVALIEKDNLGGTCLNRGCIPTKAMLSSVHILHNIKQAKSFGINVTDFEIDLEKIYSRQKKIVQQMLKGLEQLLKTYKNITIIKGEASIIASNRVLVSGEQTQDLQANNIIIATGSKCSSLGNIVVDHSQIINSDDALDMVNLPESIVIIGGGAIGIEWARIYSALGLNVTIIEMQDQLAPACDKDIANVAFKDFKRSKVTVITGIGVADVVKSPERVVLKLTDGNELSTDKVMLAVGRSPVCDVETLKSIGIELNGRYIKVDEYMQTNVPGIYAIGDVVGNLPLAHVASHEAIMVVEHICNMPVEALDYSSVPFVIYGKPELAGVGLTEDRASEKAIDYEVNMFYYAANGKAIAESEKDGIIKSIIERNTGKILGVHIAGINASDIVHQAVIAVKKGMTTSDFKEIVFAHPTYSEAFYESLLKLHAPDKSALVR